MTLPRLLVRFLCDAYVVSVLVLSTNAFLSLLVKDGSSGSPVTQALWGLIYAITFIRTAKHWRRTVQLLRANVYLSLLVALTFLSTEWSIDRGPTVHGAMILLFSTFLAIDISIHYPIVRQFQLLSVGLGIVIAFSLFFDLFFPEVIPQIQTLGPAWHGVFGAKNELGRMVTLSVATFISLPLQPKWVKAATVGGGVMIALLAHTAGALIYIGAVVLAYLWWPVLRWPRVPRNLALFVSSLLLIAIVVLASQNFTKVTTVLGRDQHLTGRTTLWQGAVTNIKIQPLLGYGYSAFWSKDSQPAWRIREEANWKDAPHSHNGYLDLTLGIGMFGLGIYTCLLVTLAERSYFFFVNDLEGQGSLPLTFLMFVTIYQFTESSIVTGNTIVWIIFCCLAFSLPTNQRRPPRFSARPQRFTTEHTSRRLLAGTAKN